MNEQKINGFLGTVIDAANSLLYYVTEAVNVLTNNPTLLIASLFLLMTTGRSLQIAKNVKYKG